MKIQRIEDIRNKFKNRKEWLLIRVAKMDETTTTPLSGRLVAHSPNRDEIYKKSMKGKGLLMVEYTERKFPKRYAAAFQNGQILT